MAKTCPICGTSYPDSNAFCTTDGATLRNAESTLDLVGAVIADRYRVTELLGEGGMGRVYLAKHVRLPQQAAIKVLHPAMVSESGAVARFNREAANAARIEHDRVARVFDFGETSDGLVYLAMEYVPGKTLRTLLMEEGHLTPARAANLLYQVAEGLDAAHRIHIVHRDLKPDNILVMTDAQGVDRAKVVDFGIAKAVDRTESTTQLTQAGMLVGTPEFMSPEQVFGETVDARSDVYALALVGYQMLTGTLPFEGNTPERALAARVTGEPKTLAEAVPDVPWPDDLQRAISAALERDLDTRTSSAIEFADAVVAAVENWTGASVLRPRTPLSTPALVAQATATRSPTPAFASTAVTPASTRAGISTSPATSGASAVVTKPRSNGIFVAGAAIAVLLVGGGGAAFYMSKRPADTPADSSSVGATPSAPVTGGGAPASDTKPSADQPNSMAVDSKGATGATGTTGTKPNTAPAGTTSSPPSTSAAPTSMVANPPAEAANVTPPEVVTRLETLFSLVGSSDDEEVAKNAITQLKGLLPRLRNATDSSKAYMALGAAHFTLNDSVNACHAFDDAKRKANARQLQAIHASGISCSPLP